MRAATMCNANTHAAMATRRVGIGTCVSTILQYEIRYEGRLHTLSITFGIRGMPGTRVQLSCYIPCRITKFSTKITRLCVLNLVLFT